LTLVLVDVSAVATPYKENAYPGKGRLIERR
jgi:hypothetical protein